MCISIHGVNQLNPGKAAGLDGITPRVVRELVVEIAPILTTVYQVSHNSGTVLGDWRVSVPDVAPVLVTGDCP